MTIRRRAFAAAALTVMAVVGTVRAQEMAAEAAASPSSGVFLLDEYNVDVFGGPDSSRIAVGLTFGTAYGNGWWWNAGPRLSWLRWNADVPKETGFGAGGTFGGGWHPEKTVSPYAALNLDRAFGMGDVYEWQTTFHAGARVKVTPDPREHFTMTFSIFQTSVFGGDGPHGSDFGIAVLYSAALYARKR